MPLCATLRNANKTHIQFKFHLYIVEHCCLKDFKVAFAIKFIIRVAYFAFLEES